MITAGENRRLVTEKPVEVETSGELSVVLEESIAIPQMDQAKPEDVNM